MIERCHLDGLTLGASMSARADAAWNDESFGRTLSLPFEARVKIVSKEVKPSRFGASWSSWKIQNPKTWTDGRDGRKASPDLSTRPR